MSLGRCFERISGDARILDEMFALGLSSVEIFKIGLMGFIRLLDFLFVWMVVFLYLTV